MAISFNTAATAPSVQASSTTLTIPAGVLSGDVMILVVNGFSSGASVSLTVSSTGTAFTQIGTTQQGGTASGFTTYGGIYYAVASGTDAGKVITIGTTQTGGTLFICGALAAYTGASNTTPIDVSGGAASSTSPLTVPSKTTTVTGDWAVYPSAFGENPGANYTAPGGVTQRAKTEVNGVGAGIWDSNGSVGSSGTSIGGINFTSVSGTLWLTGFTIGLAPPGGGPVSHNDTGALTVTPARSNTLTHGHNPTGALTVTPAKSNTLTHGHNPGAALTVTPARTNTQVHAATKQPSLTVRPVFANTVSGGRKVPGGGPDRHRWWKP